MEHFILLIVCYIALYIFNTFKFIKLANELVLKYKSTFKLINNKKISDHWKEMVLPIYSYNLILLSIKILLILSLILIIFFLASLIHSNFLKLSLSFFGIVESVIFVIAILKIRSFFNTDE